MKLGQYLTQPQTRWWLYSDSLNLKIQINESSPPTTYFPGAPSDVAEGRFWFSSSFKSPEYSGRHLNTATICILARETLSIGGQQWQRELNLTSLAQARLVFKRSNVYGSSKPLFVQLRETASFFLVHHARLQQKRIVSKAHFFRRTLSPSRGSVPQSEARVRPPNSRPTRVGDR